MTQAIQSFKVLGAGLAALGSIFLPRGGQGIALGNYLLAQGVSRNIDLPVKLSLFYPSEQVQEAAKNPTRAYLHGHLWDLAHKVLAATAFYLTSSYLLVPGGLKVAAWVRVFFSLVPVVLKLTHWGLDLVSIKGRCRNGIIESCKDTAYKLGKCVEMLYWGSAFVAPYVVVRQLDGLAVPITVLLPSLGFFAAQECFFSSPPSRLNELQSSSKTIEKGEWNPESLEAVAKDLAVKLNPEEQIHVHNDIRAQLEKKLETEIYPQWTETKLVSAAEQELEIRKILGREGIYEDISISLEYDQYEMQQIRLAMMLLCLNLRRLEWDSAKYDAATMQKIQKFLYLQALYYPIQLIADFENGVERRILQCYYGWKSQNPWKKLTTSDQQQAKKDIAQDPFFEPLRRMLPHMIAIGLQKFIPELQDLFLVLENLLLSKDHQRNPQVFKTDKTLYSTVESAATKTFEEVIQICQES
jgi:hypothetical protein